MRKDFIVSINYAKYLAFVAATVCVLIFQFTANSFCINLALSLYVVAFGLMCASLIIHADEVFDARKMIKQQNMKEKALNANEEGVAIVDAPSEIKGEKVEQVNLKSEMVWSIVGAIFFGLFAIFTFIVLVLY